MRLLIIVSILSLAWESASLTADEPPNVLLICVDDLRCSLGCYGDESAITPNLDRFAAKSRVFRRHYAFYAACGPSRSTLLSGYPCTDWSYLEPLSIAVQNTYIQEPSKPVSMPHCFRRNGYRTVSIGKVSHMPGGVMDADQTIPEMPFSWDRTYAPTGEWKTPWRAFFAYAGGHSYNARIQHEGLSESEPRLPYEAAEVDDEGYPDGLNAAAGIEELRELARADQPFFLAIGFYKPHLPFNAPKQYWDLYEPDELPSAPWPRPPQDVPVVNRADGVSGTLGLHDSYELTSHYRWPSGLGNVSEEEARTLKHGYYAAVSYVDAQIGKVLDEYEKLNLQDNTIVVIWSDHGYHLGDHGIWGKSTIYEWGLHCPLIVRTPRLPAPGKQTDGIVETIDVYPTLAALCGIDAPGDLPGESFQDLLTNPEAAGKPSALGMLNSSNQYIGATLRTDRYRHMEWLSRADGRVKFLELYDHDHDPYETDNLAREQAETVRSTHDQMQARFVDYLEQTERLAAKLSEATRYETDTPTATSGMSDGRYAFWVLVAGLAVVVNLTLFARTRAA